MATLNVNLTLTSTDISSDSLSMTVSDALTVVSPIQSSSLVTATTTGGICIILPSLASPRYVYLKHSG